MMKKYTWRILGLVACLLFSLVTVSCHKEEEIDDWVDLGLPSGLLWATRNVGATAPEDFGDYFAWGETEPKSTYTFSTYLYCRSDNNNNLGIENNSSLTKYCNVSSCGYNGFTDTLTILQPSDDAATVNYGGRTPTKEEWEELFNNTSRQGMSVNGVFGVCFTGSNGNSIFLPDAGYRWGNSLFIGPPRFGRYWSSSLYTGSIFLLVESPYSAWCYNVDPDTTIGGYIFRRDGLTVRAVRQN